MRPKRGGPCLALPPFSMVWHCAHLALKSFAPFLASPAGTSTCGSAITMAAGVLQGCAREAGKIQRQNRAGS
eukprot:CAMPEP_0204533858 /NCGR_PEP_ID=MMETSP0661-20131031/12537_1 /ASSEMBLY_ACC=CAM_ASM_000606 /TAXON_ID=109239 /ORGANISM="Alexandrium margalefi, Strain AMGDE01CS-322" /LENGTH=71 /DNA_ID=CAMNT_0051540261 /DNA_START=370 /DNA_END=585 /DNA_ORIENTATION=-